MNKIKVTKYGCVHYIAQCTGCDWNCAIHTDEANKPQDVRNLVRKHVRKTGHEVNIEGGTSTLYALENSSIKIKHRDN